MTSVLTLLSLLPVAYGLGPGQKHVYDVKVRFDGFIPIFGGRVAKVDVAMEVGVEGLAATSELRRASSEIRAVEIRLDGGKLPLTLESVQQYFPRTIIKMTPEGKILETDAPEIQLPVRLPGLHVKRFPDITYVPIEFPTDGVEVGREWKFTKPFGDSIVEYRCVPTSVDDQVVALDVSVRQTYTTYENEALEVLATEKDAAAKVTTTLEGKGKAVFDHRMGILRQVRMEAEAVSKALDLASQKTTERRLKTTIDTTLRAPKPASGAERARV